ncbi:apolipoprotein N-acyltransferase [Nodosilinea sp. LEGE 06152]|uniref:apolipoprotein N-acyltransferase n=1 Tax=Nodosilinea sp. LEGE 06152 TaxID=2777966 RepID=UPI001882459C|nr:apolipoprotein N-acyltransferase [Nodosilinea sp. LEGE 06152]MBE9156646.1 apolipoprotein N-acyltransferase [Nodosilinea sp. LEGE 06152]MBE9160493.1 apolipoprotein N-acyltransferase [Nodosilinea sp. LEGE 06152]
MKAAATWLRKLIYTWDWRQASLVALSGVLMAIALPPLSLWPLAWVGLVPLWWVVVATPSIALAAAYGLLWGLVYYGISLAWITHLHPLMWMGVPWLSSVAIALSAWIFIVIWGSVCIAAWGGAIAWLTHRWPGRRVWTVLAGTALWCTLETLRNYSPLDWSPLSLSQSPNNLWILHLTRLSGPQIISAILVATNGLLAVVLTPHSLIPSSFPSSHLLIPASRRRSLALTACALVFASHLLGARLYAQAAPAAAGQSLTLGLVQGNVPTREKLTPQGVRQALEGYTEGYRSLVEQGVAAVVTPEGALPQLWNPNSPQLAAMLQTVGQAGVPLWLGTFAPVPGEGRTQYTQSILELRTDGQYHGRYNKVQLVPLGEYIPFEALLGRLISRLSPLDSYLVPGQPMQQFETSVGKVTVGICYESAYSRLFRRQTRAGGEFVVTASNNDPYPVWMMQQHHGFDVLRAVESDRWALRVTNTGLSGLVDNHGRTLWLGEPQTYLVHRAELERRQTLTPYVRWGDWLTPLLLGLTVAWGWWGVSR